VRLRKSILDWLYLPPCGSAETNKFASALTRCVGCHVASLIAMPSEGVAMSSVHKEMPSVHKEMSSVSKEMSSECIAKESCVKYKKICYLCNIFKMYCYIIKILLIMKVSQSNYLNMASAVITLFDKKLSAWRNIPVLVEGVERVRKIIVAIRESAIKQEENKPTGHTVAKERSRDELENLMYQTAVRVRSYAGATENDVLADQMRISHTSLDKMKTNDLLTFAHVIADACTANLPALTDYLIDESTVDSLRKIAEQTAQLYAQRDVVIDQRMEATSRLEQLFTQARTSLKTLDDLAEGYIEDDAFLAEYFNARRIHDIRGRKTKPAVNEDETPMTK
jgi:hypothetical protein